MAKILVADDNSNIQKMVGLALKDQGIDVVAVGNGEAAVRKISDIRPDLVLADVFMPVRNGYEVCKYVKDDPTLAHIPVILLVGAFDPLDEQEAQRVGADGVLKKPFVPPDPLISMVKSALIRAGVPLGPPAAAPEKPAPPPRMPTEQLAPKLAALAPESLPEIQSVPMDEEFPIAAKPISIGTGESPVAFGSLLETPAIEEEEAFLPKKMEIAADRNWGADEEIEEEEEVEEETPRGSWRPSALDGVPDEDTSSSPSRGVPDWREAAFHGNSPAKKRSSEWSPTTEPTELVEAAEARSVAVSTLEHKPEETVVPFSGDAWAAAMSAGVEEKLAQAQTDTQNSASEVPMEEIDHATVEKLIRESRDHAASVAEEVVEEPVAQSEHVSAEIPAYEPPKEPANSWFSNQTTPWEIDAHKATALAATWDASPAPEPFAPTPEPIVSESSTSSSFASSDVSLSASAEPEETFEAVTPQVDETQEVSVQAEPESISTSSVVAEPEPSPVSANDSQADELVARVLAKMSPDLLQKLTSEILKPVIETIVRDELSGKK